MRSELKDLALLILASPIYVLVRIFQSLRAWRFWKVSYTPNLTCTNCGEQVALTGLWRCHCGYTYRGHLVRQCPVCHTTPFVARCYCCGVTMKLPER